MTAPTRNDDTTTQAGDDVAHAPIYCRFHDTETCRGGLNIDEHRLETGGFRHPDGLDAKGRWAFGAEAVQ